MDCTNPNRGFAANLTFVILVTKPRVHYLGCMDDATYYARRLAAEMFLDPETKDPLLDFRALYRQRTHREASAGEVDAAAKIFELRSRSFTDPPPSASGLAFEIPDLVIFDPFSK